MEVGNRIFTRYRQYSVTKSLANVRQHIFDLNSLGRYKGPKFQNPPFYLDFLADMSSVKSVYLAPMQAKAIKAIKTVNIWIYVVNTYSMAVCDILSL